MTKGKSGRQLLFSTSTVLGVAAVCYPFAGLIGHHSVALILLLAVSVLAMRLSLTAVLSAALLSALVWDFFFIPPYFTFTIGSGEDVLLMVMYFIVASLNGVINYRMRQLEQVKREKTDREKSLKLYNTLFSSLSHDLRTPIAAVLGAADILLDKHTQLSEIQREELTREISKGALRLNEQVENLLNMSRIEAGGIQPKPAWCDLEELIYGVIQKTGAEAENHRITVSIPEGFPLVQLDFGMTAQLLQNLLTNAFRHTPAGSKIHISARIDVENSGHFETNDDETDMNLIKSVPQYKLRLELSDDGDGFPEEEIDAVFDKFYRPSNTKADGTGLGLYVVRGFTEAQGGEIRLQNLPGKGARFTLEFPTTLLQQSFSHA